MKTKTIIIIHFLFFSMLTIASNKTITKISLEETVEAVFDGKEDYGYNFIATDEDDNEYTITFQNIDEKLLKEFDLKSDTLIGVSFKITYKITTETYTDEDGFENENEVYTIVKMVKI